ncbi:hypothetical protein YC2023_015515 [Brassica napus]
MGPPKLSCLRKKDETHQDAEDMSTIQNPRDALLSPEERRSGRLHTGSSTRAETSSSTRRRHTKRVQTRKTETL